MATITIRGLDDAVKMSLRIRAARNNRSMEQEAREILRASLAAGATGQGSLYRSIRARLEPLGGVELPEFPRQPVREPLTIE